MSVHLSLSNPCSRKAVQHQEQSKDRDPEWSMSRKDTVTVTEPPASASVTTPVGASPSAEQSARRATMSITKPANEDVPGCHAHLSEQQIPEQDPHQDLQHPESSE